MGRAFAITTNDLFREQKKFKKNIKSIRICKIRFFYVNVTINDTIS